MTPDRTYPTTAELWATQDQQQGDRRHLFSAVAESVDASTVLYPGSYVDLAPSFVFGSVTYLDVDKRAARFFADTEGVREIVADHDGPSDPDITFIHSDYRSVLDGYLIPKKPQPVTIETLHEPAAAWDTPRRRSPTCSIGSRDQRGRRHARDQLRLASTALTSRSNTASG